MVEHRRFGIEGIVETDAEQDDFEMDFSTRYVKSVDEKMEEAYQLGVLHGINAQSMAQTKSDVMGFEDYGWSMEKDERERPDIETQVAFKGDYDEGDDGSD